MNEISTLLKSVDEISKINKSLKVVIVGAGLAGLCAAYELENQGHTTVVLEADSEHIGGRVRTLRFGDNFYAEAGAMRIPLKHQLVLHYVNRFKLPLRKFVSHNPEAYYYVQGRKERIENVLRLNQYLNLSTWEKRATPHQLWKRTISAQLNKLSILEKSDIFSSVFETEAVQALDRLSLRQLFIEAGLSEEAVKFLTVVFGGEAYVANSAVEHLRLELNEIYDHEFYEIVGGTDLLRSKPMLGCEVVRLEQNFKGRCAAAIYRTKSKLERVEGDFILCTLPFSILRGLEINPALSEPKKRAIQELHYDSSTKVFAIANRRFWEMEDRIFGGSTFTDLPTGTVYYPSDNADSKNSDFSKKSSAILASYTWGQSALRLGMLSPDKQAEFVVQNIAKIHPQFSEPRILQGIVSWSWDKHQWSKGAYAWYLPGQSELHQYAVAPEGKIHFAGEHTSLNTAWMQGALESSVRAVKEILSEESSSFKLA
jgi:monoamine oxidase